MNISDLKKVFEKFSPTCLASNWDNVGFLIEPTSYFKNGKLVKKILLTNDLTSSVLNEAVDKKVHVIWSYHPPLFKPVKKLTQNNWKERLTIQCIENDIALFSPHTAVDAVVGGLNYWLLSPFDLVKSKVLQPSSVSSSSNTSIFTVYFADVSESELFFSELRALDGVSILPNSLQFVVQAAHISSVLQLAQKYSSCQWEKKTLTTNEDKNGYGRFGQLATPLSIQTIVDKTKKLLGIEHVMLALAPSANQTSLVSSIAVCAGSGSSVLKDAPKDCNLFITGEMSHHEVLDCTEAGISVILTRHSSSERGFLTEVKRFFDQELKQYAEMDVIISVNDCEPLQIL